MSNPSPLKVNYCVIVPTYNNEKTLKKVLDGVLNETKDVIVVNDGATDSTASILNEYQNKFTLIQYGKNQGKGYALRTAFTKALELGYEYAITIDSDGQHYPEDIPLFVKYIQENPNSLVIGSRDMNQEGVPGKSSFGHKFSNFWFWFETGVEMKDTQSGFRIYPIKIMPKKWYTKKFEFEIECIVRSSWNGINVCNIPIQIKYDPNERVSHFRPFQDFSRISVINAVLVVISIFYIKPRDFFRRFKKKSLREFFLIDVVGSNDSPTKKSLSIALGVFIGILPIWGFQTITVLFLAVLFNLNKLLAFASSNVSIPPMIPIIVFASIQTGGLIFNSSVDETELSNIENVGLHIKEYVVGSIVLATVCALLIGLTSYLTIITLNRKKG
jgi:glycosyltransferase involved in cell wall biosynthesis